MVLNFQEEQQITQYIYRLTSSSITPYEHNVGTYGLYDIETPDEIKQILQEERDITKEWFDEIKASANKKNIQVIKTELVATRSSIESAISS